MINEYIYSWGNNEKRKTLKGRRCIVLKRGSKNSILIEFLDNGQREVVSRNSIRKPKVDDIQNNKLFDF
jgi:hypothetical protein